MFELTAGLIYNYRMGETFIDIGKWLIFGLFLISSYDYGGMLFHLARRAGALKLCPAEADEAGRALYSSFRLGAGFVVFSTLIFGVFAAQAAGRASFIIVLLAPFIIRAAARLSSGKGPGTSPASFESEMFSPGFFGDLKASAAGFIRRVKNAGAGGAFVAALAPALLAAAFITSLPPQYSWDAMAYQMEIPKRYIAHGGLYFIEDIHFAGHPKLLNMLYSFFMMFGKDSLCATLHFIFLLLCYLIVVNFDYQKHAGGILSPAAARVAGLLLVAHPQVLVLCSWAYIDLGLTFYFTASALCLLSAEYRLCAFFIGAAISAKYTGLLAAIIFLAAFLYIYEGNLKDGTKTAAALALISAVVFSPYMAANFYFTANPFYPFFDSYMPFKTFSYEHLETYLATLERVGGGRGLLDMLLYPYHSMINSRVHGNLYYDGLMGMTFFAMLPFFVYAVFDANRPGSQAGGRARAAVNAMAIIFGFYYIFVLRAQSTRFFIPAAPVFYIVSVYGIKIAARRLLPPSARGTALVALGIFLAANAFPAAEAFDASRPYRFLIGAETRASFLERNLAPYSCMLEFEKILARRPESKLMTIYEPRLYYLSSNYLWRDVFEPSALEEAVHSYFGADAGRAAAGAGGLDFVSNELSRAGITHILAKDRALEIAARNFDDARKESLFQDFIARRARALSSHYGFTLYEIIRADKSELIK